MAYREFENEKTYAAPESNGFMSHTMNTIHNQLADKARERKANLTEAQRFKMDVGKAGYSSDQDVLNQHAQEITGRAIQELKTSGQLSAETSLAMQDHETMLNKSILDKKLADQVRAKIKENSDNRKNYYIGKVDDDLLMDAEYNGPISERQERIMAVANKLGGINTFAKGAFIADHIQQQKLNKLQTVTDQSGKKTTNLTSAIFMKPDGTPGVTDNHIVEMFNKDPRVEQWYDREVDKQLTDEIGRMKAIGNDPRVSWMKGMSDEDIKAAIIKRDADRINNPSLSSLNIINGTKYGQRKKDLAREDLSVGQDLNRSTSVDYADTYGNNGGLYRNTKIGYNPTPIEQSINSRKLGGSNNTNTVGADLTYVDTGKPLKFITNTPHRINTGTGEVSKKASDNMEFNLRNYGLYIYDKEGNMYPTNGNNMEELKASVDRIISKYGSQVNLNPDMSIGLNGFTINQSKLGTQSLEKQSQLADEYNKAMDSENPLKAEQIKRKMDQLKDLSTTSSNINVDDIDLLITAKQLGISGLQNDMIVKAGDQDFAKLKSMTNGLDLRNKDKWTEDMRELAYYYNTSVAKTKSQVAEAQKKVVNKTTVIPKVGDKKGGYEFLGGDPSKPESWKKL